MTKASWATYHEDLVKKTGRERHNTHHYINVWEFYKSVYQFMMSLNITGQSHLLKKYIIV